MTKKPQSALTLAVYGVSVAFHVALATAAVLAPKVKKSTVVAISLADAHKASPKPEPCAQPPSTSASPSIAPLNGPHSRFGILSHSS